MRPRLSRNRKNDNCRIEQKNGSVIREYFGGIRLDRHGHYPAPETLCRDIVLYTNLFRPCKKLVTKELKEGKGVKYRKRYDASVIPLHRLLRHLPPDDPCVAGYVRQRETVNMVTLRKASCGRSSVNNPSPRRQIEPFSVSTHLTDAPVT